MDKGHTSLDSSSTMGPQLSARLALFKAAQAANFQQRKKRHRLRYGPRFPMTQLPDEYRVTDKNPNPPLVHFGIPVDWVSMTAYAKRHNFADKCYTSRAHDVVYIKVIRKIVARLSKRLKFKITLRFAFAPTAESIFILQLYSNKTMDKMDAYKDNVGFEERVIEYVKSKLALDESVRPKWYFDFHDPFEPSSYEEEQEGES